VPNATSSSWPQRRSNASAQLLVQFGFERGLGLSTMVAGTGLTPAMLARSHDEIDAAQELALVRNLVRELGDPPGLGVAAGRAYHLTSYGIWGYALISSATARKAVELGLRYLDLTFAFTRIRLEEAGAEARMVVDGHEITPDVRAFLVERDLAAAVTALREVANPAPPLLRVAFAHGAPRDDAAYVDAFGIRPSFRRDESFFSFAAEVLDRPMPETDPQTARACERECRELLARRRARVGLAAQVRDRVLAQPGRSDIETIAREFAVTSRTLRRRLEAEGTSFRALQNETRQVLAEEFLATGAMTIEDISERLGYSDPSNFVHAFRRWTGATPGSFALRSRRSGPRRGL
jgi:AraC-like DNA-binding protein